MGAGTDVPYPLSQGVGYGVIVGLGVAFAIGMIFVTKALKRSFGEDNETTETFMVANRSVGTGLTSSAVISSWTYPTALLASPYLTYWYGIALPIWWANGQSVMICFFAYLAIQAKLKCPSAHTLLELIHIRYGPVAHIIWIILALLNNIFNFTSMLVGASTAVSSLTGMDIVASTFLLPLGVCVYTYFGGLRATYLTDYVHTFIIMVLLCWFTIKVITIAEIGSIGQFYEMALQMSKERPVDGNYDGSYLTMSSRESVIFGVIHIVTNFAIVIMDTGFWQKGFSADIPAAVPGYIIGGNAYFAIPWAWGTIVGLGCLVLENTPAFPTYPRRMSAAEVSGGLVLPFVSQAVAGTGGAVAVLFILFMACTSIASAQLIAMSSIISFDIYGGYIKPNANNKQLIAASHIGVVVSALFVSCFATALHKGGVDLNWTLYMLGVVVCPGMFPTIFTLLWRGQSRPAAIISPIVGMACGFAVWFGTAYAYYGAVTIASTGQSLPCMYGCLTSCFVPLPLTIIISYLYPTKFEWKDFLVIESINAAGNFKLDEAKYFTPERVAYMKKMSRLAVYWAAAAFCGQVLFWPLPMYGAQFVFSKGLFTAWIVVALIWLFITLLIANFYPLIDGGFHKIWIVLSGKKEAETVEVKSGSASNSDLEEQAAVLEEKNEAIKVNIDGTINA